MTTREFFLLVVKARKYIKFVISGVLAAFCNLFLLFVLHGILHVQVVLAASLSFVFAFLVSFSLQKLWTFSDLSGKRWKFQMVAHFSVGLLGLVINAFGIYFLVELLSLWYLLAQAILALSLSVFNFLIYHLIFRTKKEEEVEKIKPKKILIASGIYLPESGGPATYSSILKKELPKSGYKIKILSYGKEEQPEKDVYRVSRNGNALSRYLRYFKKALELAKWADLVYVQGPVSEGLPSYFACRLRRKKYVLKVVGDFAWEQGCQRGGVEDTLDEFQTKSYGWRVELWRLVEIIVANGAQQVITPSEYLKKIVALWGVQSKKIRVIYNSANTAKNYFDKEESKNQLALGGKVLLSASRLVPWKGFSLLIQAVAELSDEIEDLSLYIAGSGPMEEELKKLIYDLGMARRVVLLGHLKREELWCYMRASDAFILNTSYEGMSHLLIEAMSLYLPVITTRVGGNPELVEDRVSGVLFEHNNKEQIKMTIRNLYGNMDSFKNYAEVAKSRLNRFSQEKMMDDLMEVFESL